jgi:esterase/lipase superfamily enzyme
MRSWFVSLCLLCCILPTATPAQDRQQRYRVQLTEFQRLLDADAPAALALAQSDVERARALKPDDQTRGDAIERLALALVKLERFEPALAAELVRIRRAARPVDYELVGLAQGLHALALFATDRAAEADRVLRDQLATWRRAYDSNDLRLAQKLESHAEWVQKGFGRPGLVVTLLGEAVTIRERLPDSSRGRLAATLQELALHQLQLDRLRDADANLVKAQRLLSELSAASPKDEELRAGLAQTLVLRAGIAGALADTDRARQLASQARALAFVDRVLRAENETQVAAALANILERADDIPGAIAQLRIVLDTFARNPDLVANGSLDPGGIADTELWLARLVLKLPELDVAAIAEARRAVESARSRLGDSPEVLFRLAEIERTSGRAEAALDLYRKALTARKEAVSEVEVYFGTNRTPVRGGEPARFGAGTDATMSFGHAVVLVPGGQFSLDAWLKTRQPAPLPVGRATDAAQLEIRSKDLLEPATFRQRASGAMGRARLYQGDALVFIHGYNVQFDEALRRGAQLARDLNFDGPAFVFSWPSKGGITGVFYYGIDQATAANAIDALVSFLRDVHAATGAQRIHILAHSMGNRVLLPALIKIANAPDARLKNALGEVVFAAPAVPEREYLAAVDELAKRGLNRFTLYASSMDRALLAGNIVDGRVLPLVTPVVLAGFVANGEPVLHPKVQSIDLSEARAGLLNMNHDVFATNPVLTEDMRLLLQRGERRPERRLVNLLVPRQSRTKQTYWVYRRPE